MMQRAVVSSFLAPLAAALTLSASCASEPQTVTLTVDQVFGVTFDQMQPGIAHTNDPDAIVTTKDMSDEPNYKQLRPRLVCVGIDLEQSFLQVIELTKPDAAPVLFNYQLDIREIGKIQWQLLAELEIELSEAQRVFWSDSRMFDPEIVAPAWTIIEAGVSMITDPSEGIALSETTQYQVRFTGTAPNAHITSLEIEVHMQLEFANMASECP